MKVRHHIARSGVLSILVLSVACGINSGPTFPDASKVGCGVTEAYANDYLMAVIGKDVVPTEVDAINIGNCEFDGAIIAVRVQLTGNEGSQTAVINLPDPTRELRLPFHKIANLPLIDVDLPTGRYARTVTGITAGGREIDIPIFEDVLLLRDPGSLQADLLRHQGRWERSRVANYVYTGAWNCFCPTDYIADAEVTVRGGVVVRVASADPAVPNIPDPERFVSVEALFVLLQSALDENAARIDVTYNKEYGYPEQFFVDYHENMADEERGFVIRSLTYQQGLSSSVFFHHLD